MNLDNLKWDVRSLKLYMVSKHGWRAVNQLFNEIQVRAIIDKRLHSPQTIG